MIAIFLLLIIISAALTYFYYRDTNPPLSRKNKILLGSLRFIFFLIVFILLLSPVLHFTDKSKIPPEVVIAIDSSTSMKEIMQNGKSKLENASNIVSNIEQEAKRKNLKLKTYNFSNGLSSDSTKTDIFLALNQISQQEQANNLKKIILISDGLHHNSNNFNLLDNINEPVYPIEPGKPKKSFDISIESIQTNNPVYKNFETEIKATVSGLENKMPIRLSLWQNDQKLLQKQFTATAGSEDFTLNYQPMKLGYQKFILKISAPENTDSNQRNNQKQFLLYVVKNKLQITLISSQLNWDPTFVNRALKKNKKFETNFLVKRKQNYFSDGKETNVKEFLDCDLLILHNNEEFNFSETVYDRISKYLENGGNILYLNKIDPEIEEILPLRLSKYKKNVEAKIKIKKNAQNYQTFKLEQNWMENDEFWRSLPPITAQFYSAKNNAQVLAKADIPTQNPVIAFSSYGKGHVMMFALSGLYRWKMWQDSASPWFDNFTNSVTNWLINAQTDKRFICNTDKLQYLSGDEIKFSAHVFDEKMNTISNQDISLAITKNDSSFLKKYLTESANKYTTRVTINETGRYRYQAEAKIGNKVLTDSGEFLVDKMTREQSTKGINNNILSFIANKTNGKLDANITDLFNENYTSKTVKTKIDFNLWKKWYIALIAIAIFSLELFLRKRKGLL